MKVCDKHKNREALDTFHMEQEDTFIDVCGECKRLVLEFLSTDIEELPKKGLLSKVFGKTD